MAGVLSLKWVRDLFLESDSITLASQAVALLINVDELEKMFASFTPEQQSNPAVKAIYDTSKEILNARNNDLVDPFSQMVAGWIDVVKDIASRYKLDDPATALDQAALMGKEMMALNSSVQALEFGLGAAPNGLGTVAATKVQSMWNWLGFGAVINAITHDPVKIALLRPWSDSLEAIYRNRRFDHIETLNAYKQRSLSTIPVPDIDMITDEVMDQIEEDNNKNLFEFMAKHGFKDDYIKIMQDASTRALTFGNLSQMAKMGHYNRQEAIFSLWTFGMDRRIMYSSLAALETMRDVSMWKGFRSMVEPSYVQGLIEAEDLKEYWTRILVPEQVQEWALVRLTKSREKFLAKEERAEKALTRDLTKADWTTAFTLGNISEDAFTAKLASLGYDADEITVLVSNAKSRIKTEKTATCKKLPLSDYELAHNNGILTLQQVLDRMRGEYCQADIDLESQLLQIDDLTSEAPANEKDLAAGTVTTAYVESVRSREETEAYLRRLGYDDQEVQTLISIAEIKKETWEAKRARDEALAEAKRAKEELAQARAGLKRLPLTDYEKAWQAALISEQDVLDRMKGEYTEYDIGLEKLMMANGIARKG